MVDLPSALPAESKDLYQVMKHLTQKLENTPIMNLNKMKERIFQNIILNNFLMYKNNT